MPETDWKEAYFQQQRELAKKLGCNAHPNDIDARLRDLQRRAAGGDRKRARRRARLKTAMIKALRSEGVIAEETKMVADDLDRIAERLVEP
jgi:hypothetical protein